MKFTRLVPNIFYVKIKDGITFFVECLGFKIVHEEFNSQKPFCVIEKDGVVINLFE